MGVGDARRCQSRRMGMREGSGRSAAISRINECDVRPLGERKGLSRLGRYGKHHRRLESGRMGRRT